MNSGDPIAPGSISVIDAIRQRRSVRAFQDRPVPRASLERMLDAARWAPNHRLTAPWRFFMLEKGGKGRADAARLAREWTFQNNEQLPEPKRSQVAEASEKELVDAPMFMYAYSVPGPNAEVTQENYTAVGIAVQNFQLAALAEGLAVGWTTGRPTRHPGLASALGADPSWQMVGGFFIGYPAARPRSQRPDISEHTVWL